MWSRNLDTGGHNETETEYVPAMQTIHHSKQHPSYVILPRVTDWCRAGVRTLGLAGAVLAAAVAFGCAARLRQQVPGAELVLTHAQVYTLDPGQPWAEALAISGGSIVALGSHDDVMRHRGSRTRVVDLHGQLVLPGFHDSHVHPVTGGIELGQCALTGITGLDALRATLQRCVEAQAGEPWLLGGGWELTLFPSGNPSRQLLDELVPDVPAFLVSADGHSSWLNSEGLRRSGITAATPDPPNGRIERDAAGEPSGTLREDAAKLAHPHLPKLPPEVYDEGLRRGLALANRFGIVGMYEAAGEPEVLAAYERIAAAGELTARMTVAQPIDPLKGPEQLDALAARRARIDHPRLHVSAIKIFVDGVIEAGTAALLEPYVGRASAGEPTLSDEALDLLVGRADALGFDVHVHAIGDRAVRMALSAFERARDANPPRSRRHVIAHLELIDPDDIPRFHELNVTACFQPLWAQRDSYITELTIPVLGSERSRWLYPLGSVLASGATVVAGSDWSVSSMNPLEGIQVALTRRGVGEPPGEAWIPEERATLHDMLQAYTLHGAWLGRWYPDAGWIIEGAPADLAVLDGNLFELPAHRIAEARVVTTMLEGEVVFRGPGDRIGGS
jgi:predicted amidohydrolase YtcJ